MQVYFKWGNTIKNLPVGPNDKDTITQKSGMIYGYTCDRVKCNEEYIDLSARTLGERLKSTLKPLVQFMNTVASQAITLV